MNIFYLLPLVSLALCRTLPQRPDVPVPTIPDTAPAEAAYWRFMYEMERAKNAAREGPLHSHTTVLFPAPPKGEIETKRGPESWAMAEAEAPIQAPQEIPVVKQHDTEPAGLRERPEVEMKEVVVAEVKVKTQEETLEMMPEGLAKTEEVPAIKIAEAKSDKIKEPARVSHGGVQADGGIVSIGPQGVPRWYPASGEKN